MRCSARLCLRACSATHRSDAQQAVHSASAVRRLRVCAYVCVSEHTQSAFGVCWAVGVVGSWLFADVFFTATVSPLWFVLVLVWFWFGLAGGPGAHRGVRRRHQPGGRDRRRELEGPRRDAHVQPVEVDGLSGIRPAARRHGRDQRGVRRRGPRLGLARRVGERDDRRVRRLTPRGRRRRRRRASATACSRSRRCRSS